MKRRYKFLYLILCMVLVISCTFSSIISSASYTLNITPASLTNLKAYYEKGDIVDTGTQTLSYSGMGMVNGLVYYKYSNAPFNIGAPTYEGNNGESYSVAVEISNLNFQLPISSEVYTVRTRVAIGNNSQIFSFPDKFFFGIYAQGGELIKNCDFTIDGNVAYVNDYLSREILTTKNLSLRLEFQFGSRFNSSVTWSSSTHLWLTNIIFERATDNSDIVDAITGDGTYSNPEGDAVMSEIDSFESSSDALMDSLPETDFNFDSGEILSGIDGGFPVVATILNNIINNKVIFAVITFILALGLALYILGRRLGK